MDVRKKVLLDLFASPGTLLPIVGGFSSLILSWAVGGASLLNFLGIAGILGGLGALVTRLIFRLQAIANDAYEYVHSQELQRQEQALDELDRKLTRDGDSRTQGSLRKLRDLYETFVEDVKSGKVAGNTQNICETVEELFRACVAQFEHSYQLWMTAKKLSGDAKQRILQEREEVVQEVIETFRHLEGTVGQFHCFTTKTHRGDLTRLREELDEAMRVARRTEERMASWNHKAYVETESE